MHLIVTRHSFFFNYFYLTFFYFCFLYVNVQYSFIIHLHGSHAVRYDIHHNFSILQTCKVLILFHRSSIGSSIHMFVILLTLIFIFLILFGMTFIFFFSSSFNVMSCVQCCKFVLLC